MPKSIRKYQEELNSVDALWGIHTIGKTTPVSVPREHMDGDITQRALILWSWMVSGWDTSEEESSVGAPLLFRF